MKLPAGVPLRVQAAKGPEFTPLDQAVTLGPGQMALRFTITRWSNLADEGWVGGDSRCHFITPHAALLEAAAEDLAVVNLLTRHFCVIGNDATGYVTTPHLAAFSGQAPALERDGRVVVVNTLNTHAVLGSIGLLNSHRVVYPLAFGEPYDTDDWSVCDWCDQCHRKGGLAIWIDPFRPAAGQVGGEALFAAVLGKIDAIEIDDQPRTRPLLPWVYRLWNAGYPIPLVGGSGKDANKGLLGGMRTYAKVLARPERGQAELYRDWVEAARAGRTFVTNGPLIRIDVANGDPLRITSSAESLTPFDTLDVLVNGEVIGSATAELTGTRFAARLEVERGSDGATWVAARCTGRDGEFAHTSSVPVRAIGEGPCDRTAAGVLAQLVGQIREWVEHHGRFASDKSKQHLLELCDTARARLEVQA